MKKRRSVAIALAAFGALFVLLGLWRSAEPYYGGRPLSYWVIHLWEYPGQNPAAAEAVRRIGTNGLPWLINWLESPPEQPRLRRAAGWLAPKLPAALAPQALFDWASNNPQLRRDDNASIAIGLLGADARPVVPHLGELVGEQAHSTVAARAAHALVVMGAGDLVPIFAANLTNGHPNRWYYAVLIGQVPALTTNAGPAIPALLQCLHDPDPRVAQAAATTLGNARLQPETTIPALVDYLRKSPGVRDQLKALGALARFGTQARGQAVELVNWLNHSNQLMRLAATNALEEIAPEVLTSTSPPRSN